MILLIILELIFNLLSYFYLFKKFNCSLTERCHFKIHLGFTINYQSRFDDFSLFDSHVTKKIYQCLIFKPTINFKNPFFMNPNYHFLMTLSDFLPDSVIIFSDSFLKINCQWQHLYMFAIEFEGPCSLSLSFRKEPLFYLVLEILYLNFDILLFYFICFTLTVWTNLKTIVYLHDLLPADAFTIYGLLFMYTSIDQIYCDYFRIPRSHSFIFQPYYPYYCSYQQLIFHSSENPIN